MAEKPEKTGKPEKAKPGKPEKSVKVEKPVKAEKPVKTEEAENPDMKLIVRIANKDLDGKLPINRALTGIKGIGIRMATIMAAAFEKEQGLPAGTKLGEISEEQHKVLEEVAMNPGKHGIPIWALNRQREYVSGQDKHLLMAELDFDIRENIKRLNEIKSYRGLRHSWGLPVRGQRTKSTHRGKGGTVVVMKKDAREAIAKSEKEEKK